MTETKNHGEKTLSVTPTKTLTLKRGVEQGVVRQSFSHGRTKAVVVEKGKRRIVGSAEARAGELTQAPDRPAPARRTPSRGSPSGPKSPPPPSAAATAHAASPRPSRLQ